MCREINNSLIHLPKKANYCKKNVYHLFVIKTSYRNELQKYLTEKNIQTVIHYPRPIYNNKYILKHKAECVNVDKFSQEIISLPMHPFLKDEEVCYIIECINNFKV